MPRAKRWTESAIVDGVGTVRLYSWKYFMDYIYQEMLDYEKYIWRGQRCENWLLESTLDRLIPAKIPSRQQRSFRNQHLERFKFAARGRRGINPPQLEEENDWWALGQHNGLATPLLDWTTSPFVAAYFAFIGIGQPQTSRRVVFALHQPSVESKSRKIFLETKKQEMKEQKEREKSGRTVLKRRGPIRPPVEFIRPLSDENARLVSQGGLFTRSPDGENLETCKGGRSCRNCITI